MRVDMDEAAPEGCLGGGSGSANPFLSKSWPRPHPQVHFIIEVQPNKMAECLAEGLESKFKLSSKFSTSNMSLFDKDGHIKHYSSPEEIIREFYYARLDFYERRRQALIQVGGGRR